MPKSEHEAQTNMRDSIATAGGFRLWQLRIPKSLKVLAVAIGLLAVAMLTAFGSDQTFTGTITDSMCPTGDHSKMRMGPTDAECTEACSCGASYVLYDGKTLRAQ